MSHVDSDFLGRPNPYIERTRLRRATHLKRFGPHRAVGGSHNCMVDGTEGVTVTSRMEPLPLRLQPNSDLRRVLEASLDLRRHDAAFVMAGIGSLSRARLRLAGKEQPEVLDGNLEILTLAGSISRDGAHLHMSVADDKGHVIGGHVGYDCMVRTTAEVLLVLLPEWSFTREQDPMTGFAELVIGKGFRGQQK